MYVKAFLTNNIFGGINKNMETKNFYALNPLFEDLFDFPFFDKAHHHQTMKTDIEENLSSFMSKTIKLTEIKNDFETKKLDLETVADAKKLLSDVNHQITAIIE